MPHKILLPSLICAAFLAMAGCEHLENSKTADGVVVPKAEYQELRRRAELEKKYEATFQLRREILASRRRGEKLFPVNSLFNACGDTLDPNGEIYDPKNWPDAPIPSASTAPPTNGTPSLDSYNSAKPVQPVEASDGGQSLWLTVDSTLPFSHKKKCVDNYCDGFFLMAHDKSRQYGLMCVYHVEGDGPEVKEFNDGSVEQKWCQMVHTGKWRAKLDGQHMAFYSDPKTLAAIYRVTSEQ